MLLIFAFCLSTCLSYNASAQLNIVKRESALKAIYTVSLSQIWIYQDNEQYYLACISDNQFDENYFWLTIGKNKEECLASIDGLIEIAKSKKGEFFELEDTFGEKLTASSYSVMGERVVFLKDQENRYAGNGNLSILYLKKARKWIEKNID